MKKAKTKQETISDKLYYPFRIAILISVIFLFIPALNPVRISGMINRNLSLFTSGISYSALTAEFGRALKKEWVMESSLRILYGSALVICLGIAANIASGCMSLGNHKLKKLGNLISVIGCAAELAGMAGTYMAYGQLSQTSKPDRVEPMFASGFWPAVIIFGMVLVLALAQIALLAGSTTEKKFAMESKYKLFLLFLPFIALITVFAYLPLTGWRYAFFDYKAGDTLSMEKFVGFKWFQELVKNKATVRDIANTMKNTLAMSGIANEIAGSSAPTSGSEHLISHALDKLLEQPQLHGVQVGIATYLMAKVQEHRYVRVNTIFTDTGFWKYAETLGMKKADFSKAIDMAPSVKPHRHTYLHEEPYREKAKRLLEEDEILSRILI